MQSAPGLRGHFSVVWKNNLLFVTPSIRRPTPILPEHINCEGCRVDGVKTVYCDNLCSIRQCALKRGVTTCGDCTDLNDCQTISAIIANNPDAYKNLQDK